MRNPAAAKVGPVDEQWARASGRTSCYRSLIDAPRKDAEIVSAGRLPPSRRALRLATSGLRSVQIIADDDVTLDTSVLEREFPTVSVRRAQSAEPSAFIVDDFAWRDAFDLGRFDRRLEQMRPLGHLAVRGANAAHVAIEVLARYQRLVLRRNRASSTALFDAVLDVHGAAFEGRRRAAYEHALDTWQWLLRLEPEAGLAVQVAALFHEVDRLDDGAEVDRLEHLAHRSREAAFMSGAALGAQQGGGLEGILARLRVAGLSRIDEQRVRTLVAGDRADCAESAVLEDADLLSFLSLMSSVYADYFGLAQTGQTVNLMLGRLGPMARSKVALLRLRPDVTLSMPAS